MLLCSSAKVSRRMAACDWTGCTEPPTHTVTIDFPGEAPEAWQVCREHDRVLKNEAVASRPKAPLPVSEEATTEVCCGECGATLGEPSGLPAEERKPCPNCGSLRRLVKVGINETVGLHESIRVRSKRPGKGGWLRDMRSGDDYTRSLEGWGKRELTTDREHDQYREVIELHDGTRIESVAKLGDHRD